MLSPRIKDCSESQQNESYCTLNKIMRQWINLIEEADQASPFMQAWDRWAQSVGAHSEPDPAGRGIKWQTSDWQVTLEEKRNSLVYLHYIQSFRQKGGAGTMLMQKLCELADQNHVRLLLESDESNNDANGDGVDYWLHSWYERFGFEMTGGYGGYGPMMEREPGGLMESAEDAEAIENGDYDDHGWEPGDLDPHFLGHEEGLLPPTPENIERAKQFAFQKWIEYHEERKARCGPRVNYRMPHDLTNACKFTSLFARAIFGGRLRGNEAHQFVQLADGTIIDLNIDAEDVQQLEDYAHRHEVGFWGNPDHKDSVDSCVPRVDRWVNEFISNIAD